MKRLSIANAEEILFIVVFILYIMNIVFLMGYDSFVPAAFARIIGIFIPPIGVALGFLWFI